jgi:hypothetical protein
MARKPTVSLKFTSETTQLDKAFAKVKTGLDNVQTKSESLNTKLNQVSSGFGKLSIAGAAVAAGIIGIKTAIIDTTKAFADMDAAQGRLQRMMDRTNTSAEEQANVFRQADQFNRTYNISLEDSYQTMTRLISATEDSARAQELYALALDVSSAEGMSLEKVTQLLIRAQKGEITRIKELEGVDKNLIKTLNTKFGTMESGVRVIQHLQDTYQGAAKETRGLADDLDSGGAAMDRIGIAIGKVNGFYIKLTNEVFKAGETMWFWVDVIDNVGNHFDELTKSIEFNLEVVERSGGLISRFIDKVTGDTGIEDRVRQQRKERRAYMAVAKEMGVAGEQLEILEDKLKQYDAANVEARHKQQLYTEALADAAQESERLAKIKEKERDAENAAARAKDEAAKQEQEREAKEAAAQAKAEAEKRKQEREAEKAEAKAKSKAAKRRQERKRLEELKKELDLRDRVADMILMGNQYEAERLKINEATNLTFNERLLALQKIDEREQADKDTMTAEATAAANTQRELELRNMINQAKLEGRDFDAEILSIKNSELSALEKELALRDAYAAKEAEIQAQKREGFEIGVSAASAAVDLASQVGAAEAATSVIRGTMEIAMGLSETFGVTSLGIAPNPASAAAHYASAARYFTAAALGGQSGGAAAGGAGAGAAASNQRLEQRNAALSREPQTSNVTIDFSRSVGVGASAAKEIASEVQRGMRLSGANGGSVF